MATTTLARRLRRLAGTAVLAAACGCGGGDGAPDQAATTTTTTTDETTTTRLAVCEAGDLDPRQLEALVIDDVAGFSQQADDVGDTGPSDLAKAIRDDGEVDAEAVLEGTGFRAGYQRLWTAGDEDELVLFLYEFCKPEGATQYGRRAIEVFSRAGRPVEPVELGGVGTGFVLEGAAARGVWVWATSGTTLVEVISRAGLSTDPAVLVQRATDVLAVQLDHLHLPDAPDAA